MEPFISSKNYTGELQEMLQAIAPEVGCRLSDLWCFEPSGTVGAFTARVVLINTKCEHDNLELPLSDDFVNKKLSKKHASWRAIQWIQENERLRFDDGSFQLVNSSKMKTTSSPITHVVPLFVNTPRLGGMIPRPYQLQVAGAAIQQNLIVNIQTGAGKTLIAVLVMEHFLRAYPSLKVMFIVPTRALVSQQSKYIRDHCCCDHLSVPVSTKQQQQQQQQQVRVVELSGQVTDEWGGEQWRTALGRANVLVGTAEVFRIAMVDRGYIHPSSLSLLVFDECHNATGNSPMAAILLDSVSRHYQILDRRQTQHQQQHQHQQHQLSSPPPPRILGLTASFVNGAVVSKGNLEKKRRALCLLMMSELMTPDTSEYSGTSKEYHKVKVPQEPVRLEDHMVAVKLRVTHALDTVPYHLMSEQDKKKWVERGWGVYVALGGCGFLFWLREGIIRQLKAKAQDLLAMSGDTACVRVGKHMQMVLSLLIAHFSSAATEDSAPSPLNTLTPEYSQKVLVLMDLLLSIYKEKNQTETQPCGVFRGIIFVEQVALTYPLSYLVNELFEQLGVSSSSSGRGRGRGSGCSSGSSSGSDSDRVWPCRPVSGGGSMGEAERNSALDSFKRGLTPLLVSTSALEEGVDVSECCFVIRFDSLKTTKAHIQGSGRARSYNAEVYYFENDPEKECMRAGEMEAVARNQALNLSQRELRKGRWEREESGAACRQKVTYPFTSPPAAHSVLSATAVGGVDEGVSEVNIFNCVPILYQYVQGVMGQSFSPEKCLFDIDEEEVGGLPSTSVKTLLSVSFPTPRGVITITQSDVTGFWKEVTVKDVVKSPERLKNLSSFDIEIRQAVYVAVLKLHDLHYLTSTNEPSADAKAESKLACDAYQMGKQMKLRNKFAEESLTSHSSSTTTTY